MVKQHVKESFSSLEEASVHREMLYVGEQFLHKSVCVCCRSIVPGVI